jgi:hypothetical protein
MAKKICIALVTALLSVGVMFLQRYLGLQAEQDRTPAPAKVEVTINQPAPKEEPKSFATLNLTVNRSASSNGTQAPKPKILREKTATWDGSTENFARYNNQLFECGIGNHLKGLGLGAAGIEIENVHKLTLSWQPSARLTALDENSFAGFIVDYHTPSGYTKRVAHAIGLSSEKHRSPVPQWGKGGLPDKWLYRKVKPEFELDFKGYAPTGWDGTVWLTVVLQNAGTNARVTAKIERMGQ